MEKSMQYHNWIITCYSVGKPFYRKKRHFALLGGPLQPKRRGKATHQEVYDTISHQQVQGRNVIRVHCSASALASALSGIASPDGDLLLRPILY